MRLVELRLGQPIRDLLRGLRTNGASVGDMSERLGVPSGTVYRWLVRFELDDASLIRKALETTQQ
jgi:hypothetical protein